jgi:hypothetical protein
MGPFFLHSTIRFFSSKALLDAKPETTTFINHLLFPSLIMDASSTMPICVWNHVFHLAAQAELYKQENKNKIKMTM